MASFLLSAVQVMRYGASVTSPSSVARGAGSFLPTTATCQPASGFTLTEARGWSWGRKTCTLVVEVASVSFGTRKLIAVYPPWVAVPGSISTWAHPGAATSTSQPEASAARVRRTTRVVLRRVVGRCMPGPSVAGTPPRSPYCPVVRRGGRSVPGDRRELSEASRRLLGREVWGGWWGALVEVRRRALHCRPRRRRRAPRRLPCMRGLSTRPEGAGPGRHPGHATAGPHGC